MKRGYVGIIGNDYVFIVAKNINDAKDKIINNANGKSWEFDSTRHYKIIK